MATWTRTPGGRRLVADQVAYAAARTSVSEWAMFGAGDTPGEFIAETFSGLMAGLGYPQAVIDYYNLLTGPGVDFHVNLETELVGLR